MDIRDYLAAWRSRWVTIVVCVVLAVAVAAGVSALTQPKYAATARLFVSTTGGASVSEAYQGNLFSTGRVTSYASLAAGKQVAQRAIDELGLSLSPEEVMARVTAVAVPDSVLFDVSVTDPNPGLARDLANVVASQTSSLVQELETSARGGTPAAAATIVDLADVPASPSSPSWLRNLVFGLVGGLILGLVAAVVRFKLDGTVRTDDDVAAGSGAPVLGSIPPVDEAAPGSLLCAPAHSASTEAFRDTRTNILAINSESPIRTLVVAAPKADTGATTVAAGLTLALAETNRSVVLIDAGSGGEMIRKTFGIGKGPGLSDFLRGDAEVDNVVAWTQFDGVKVIASGTGAQTSSGLFGSASMGELIKQLRGSFEFIVIDGPAVLEVSDTAVLAGVADGVLLVGRTGMTSTKDLAESAHKLELAKSRIVGSIVNGRRARLLRRK